jgi:hypothetical protein
VKTIGSIVIRQPDGADYRPVMVSVGTGVVKFREEQRISLQRIACPQSIAKVGVRDADRPRGAAKAFEGDLVAEAIGSDICDAVGNRYLPVSESVIV